MLSASITFFFTELLLFIAYSICAVQAFQPQNEDELKNAVNACVADGMTDRGNCMYNGVHISQWDVSKVTD